MPRALVRPLFVTSLLLAVGCPADPGSGDAGDTTSDAGERDDAGEADAGTPPGDDAGPDLDDAGPLPEDAGEDAGDGGCVAVDPCAGTSVTGEVRFEGTQAGNAFGPDAATLVVGQATRADVEAAFGAGVAGDNPFRAWHCDYGVRVEYVDDLSGAAFEGTGSAGDVVARVVTLPGVLLSSGHGVAPGQTRAEAQAALTDPFSLALEVGAFDASATDGVSAVSDDAGEVTTVALFRPQALAAWDLAVDVPAAAIGTAPADLAREDELSVADGVLGTGYDAEGSVTVDVGDVSLDFLVRVYAAFGVRVVARCPLFGSCSATNAKVQQIILSPPFLGRTGGGLGLGSVEADVVAAFGAGTPSSESEDLVEYTGTGGRTAAVGYVTGSDCVRRAAALVLNYTSPN